jgi:hypothetical protein
MPYYGESEWPEYVPAALRRRRAAEQAAALRKKGKVLQPVVVDGRGRSIARTFWGDAWCRNLEAYSDYSNRLPRGRTYVRNGSVIDLQIAAGTVTALVQGSSLYRIAIKIRPIAAQRWKGVVRGCSGHIASLVELLRGGVSEHVMKLVTERDVGLFPAPVEISLECSCPDWATMCKHVAASLYGVGARLDERPELLFTLRGVDAAELVANAAGAGVLGGSVPPRGKVLGSGDLSSVFGIEIDEGVAPIPRRGKRSRAASPLVASPVVASPLVAPPLVARAGGAAVRGAPRTSGTSRKTSELAAQRKPTASSTRKRSHSDRDERSDAKKSGRGRRYFPAVETAVPSSRPRRAAKHPPPQAHGGARDGVIEVTARLNEFIRSRPGLRMEEISRSMGTSTKELVVPMKRLLAKKVVVARGQKRATRYFPR